VQKLGDHGGQSGILAVRFSVHLVIASSETAKNRDLNGSLTFPKKELFFRQKEKQIADLVRDY
jgi:hypothetical protein